MDNADKKKPLPPPFNKKKSPPKFKNAPGPTPPPFNKSSKKPELKVLKTTRQKDPEKLSLWSKDTLETGSNETLTAIASLITDGAKEVLLMGIEPLSKDESQPLLPAFSAKAAISQTTKTKLWNGFKWNPTLTPEMWGSFVTEGYVEFSPPGENTNIKSARNVIRTAFGVEETEFLTIVRMGTLDHCKGAVALISEKSISDDVERVQTTLNLS